MRQSKLFVKTIKQAPKDEQALNAKLLTQGGFVYKNSAGVYSFLPLGWRVLKKISDIVRQEMNATGAEEMLMPALHDKHYLSASSRWDIDVVYKVITEENKDPAFNISWTHEEIIAEIAAKYVNSYQDLPFAVYQIQAKFRSEKRVKSGLLRGREFLMKDLYSFHNSLKDLMNYYKRVALSYNKIFNRCGLKSIYTLAPGGEFTSQHTHEFQVVSDVGEDTIYVCQKCYYAENKEISKLKDKSRCIKCSGQVQEKKSIEVGNIFPLGTKYSEVFNLQFTDKDGEKRYVVMGSYGIGISRTMGTVVEIHHDDRGIIWPEQIAPFQVHVIPIENKSKVQKTAENLYQRLEKQNIEVLYDDRKDKTPGEKFADSDLIGIPQRIVVSEKTLKRDCFEIKKRNEKKIKLVKTKNVGEIA